MEPVPRTVPKLLKFCKAYSHQLTPAENSAHFFFTLPFSDCKKKHYLRKTTQFLKIGFKTEILGYGGFVTLYNNPFFGALRELPRSLEVIPEPEKPMDGWSQKMEKNLPHNFIDPVGSISERERSQVLINWMILANSHPAALWRFWGRPTLTAQEIEQTVRVWALFVDNRENLSTTENTLLISQLLEILTPQDTPSDGDHQNMKKNTTYTHIAIEGTIGAGKTTLLDALREELTPLQIYQEDVENWLSLPLFYQDPQTYAFLLQCEILASYKKIPKTGVFITERSPKASIEVFSKMQLDKKNLSLKNLEALRHYEERFLPQPTVIFYLDVHPVTAFQRVQKRGRAAEKKISLEYLTQLEGYYKNWLTRTDIPVISINAEDDFQDVKKIFLQKVRHYFFKGDSFPEQS